MTYSINCGLDQSCIYDNLPNLYACGDGNICLNGTCVAKPTCFVNPCVVGACQITSNCDLATGECVVEPALDNTTCGTGLYCLNGVCTGNQISTTSTTAAATTKSTTTTPQARYIPASSSQSVVVGAVLGSLAGILILILLIIIYRRRGISKRTAVLEKELSKLTQVHQRVKSAFERDYAEIAASGYDALETLATQRKNIALEREIGRGNFGVVHLAKLTRGRRNVETVAVKLLNPGSSVDMQVQFCIEARLMHSLQHPNIVSILGVCVTELPLMLIMEYFEHGDLRSFLRRNRPMAEKPLFKLEVGDLLGMVRQVCAAMGHLEAVRIVHRDLASRNVLVRSPGQVKLADFGMVCVFIHIAFASIHLLLPTVSAAVVTGLLPDCDRGCAAAEVDGA